MPVLDDITTKHCTVERDGHVVILTMNRPEARNALSPDMLVGLADGFSYVDDEPEVRVAILTGAGGTFSSGADLKAMAKPSDDERVRDRMSAGDNLHWKALLRDYRLSKPLIAAVEGYAVAGGTEMLQGTDIRIAGEGADLRRLGGASRSVPARRLGHPAPPPDPVHGGDGHPAQRPGGERARSQGDRAHRPGRPRRTGARGRRARSPSRWPRAGRSRARRSCEPGARPRASPTGGDGDPGQDRLGGLRQRGRAGGAARVRREAAAGVQGQVSVRHAGSACG